MFIASTIEQRDGSAHSGEKTVAVMAYVTERIGVSESEPSSKTRIRVATMMGAEQQSLDGAEQPCGRPAHLQAEKTEGSLVTTEFMSHGNT